MNPVPAAIQSCPHCGSPNDAGATFCAACGKALPTFASGPRVVTADTAGASAGGRQLLADELKKKMKRSSVALLVVAIVLTIFGPVELMMEKERLERQAGPGAVFVIPTLAYVITFGLAGGFFALWAWSRVQPFPASIVGLVLLVSIWGLAAVDDPSSIAKGIILKIFVIAALVKAIQAGAEHRKLIEQQRRETGV
jgi:hypothetical protein